MSLRITINGKKGFIIFMVEINEDDLFFSMFIKGNSRFDR